MTIHWQAVEQQYFTVVLFFVFFFKFINFGLDPVRSDKNDTHKNIIIVVLFFNTRFHFQISKTLRGIQYYVTRITNLNNKNLSCMVMTQSILGPKL